MITYQGCSHNGDRFTCPHCNGFQGKQFMSEIDTRSNRIQELEKDLALAKAALKDAFRLDRSKEYEYGEPNRNGVKPSTGQRWLTPKEIAKEALSQLEEKA